MSAVSRSTATFFSLGPSKYGTGIYLYGRRLTLGRPDTWAFAISAFPDDGRPWHINANRRLAWYVPDTSRGVALDSRLMVMLLRTPRSSMVITVLPEVPSDYALATLYLRWARVKESPPNAPLRAYIMASGVGLHRSMSKAQAAQLADALERAQQWADTGRQKELVHETAEAL